MRADPTARKLQSLTSREHDVVRLLVSQPGADNKTLASILHIGEHTLRNHLSRIYDKLGVPNRVELFVLAQRHGVPGRTGEQRKPRAKASRLKPRALARPRASSRQKKPRKVGVLVFGAYGSSGSNARKRSSRCTYRASEANQRLSGAKVGGT